jgi:UDPglucose 6-dehydrogenase
MSMRVVIVGCGHVGLVTAACLAEIGHEVVGYDSDPQKVAWLRRGASPFFEPGLDELLRRHTGERLVFEGDLDRALGSADLVFVCVNTPPLRNGKPSLGHVTSVIRSVARAGSGPLVIVERSTAPVRTTRRITDVLKEEGRHAQIEVASNPAFLREGNAVSDSLDPARIVIGADKGSRAELLLRSLYQPIVERVGCPLFVTDHESAELITHASNAFLATKISYINLIADLAEKVGADVAVVAEAMGLDPRIGTQFLHAGAGYGGCCLPKDIDSLIALAAEHDTEAGLLEAVQRINSQQRSKLLEMIRNGVATFQDKTIAVWGLAYKPGTDDLREAPSVDVIRAMEAEGAFVRAYDPVAGPAAKNILSRTEIVSDAFSATDGADALLVITDWPEFSDVDLRSLRRRLRHPLVVDGRNIWPVELMASLGFTYLSFGRPDVIAHRGAPGSRKSEARIGPPVWVSGPSVPVGA